MDGMFFGSDYPSQKKKAFRWMFYERKGHLHILEKPEPYLVDTVLGGTGASIQITPGGFPSTRFLVMATGLLMLTIQPFVG